METTEMSNSIIDHQMDVRNYQTKENPISKLAWEISEDFNRPECPKLISILKPRVDAKPRNKNTPNMQ